ncbi:hypothetical protein GCK72_022799 [Caenorhabditis remanei]|uniref:Uncharacterized protein n=1 Tax=Caenorhabditis remanei TaxID=31234 RepID=A0A6A5FV04_CAERE|nr:hypothetical protein GCK72_022799 [Caenorhabditis remanei]KAF1746346.1 hypothetical protein GCK72_022799 [Caenorhabditis remanei]
MLPTTDQRATFPTILLKAIQQILQQVLLPTPAQTVAPAANPEISPVTTLETVVNVQLVSALGTVLTAVLVTVLMVSQSKVPAVALATFLTSASAVVHAVVLTSVILAEETSVRTSADKHLVLACLLEAVALTVHWVMVSTSTYLDCPAGTMEQFDSVGEQTSIPRNNNGTQTFAFCYEAGAVAGKWLSYSDGHDDEMSGMRCKNQ